MVVGGNSGVSLEESMRSGQWSGEDIRQTLPNLFKLDNNFFDGLGTAGPHQQDGEKQGLGKGKQVAKSHNAAKQR